jgi:hypothetical protein
MRYTGWMVAAAVVGAGALAQVPPAPEERVGRTVTLRVEFVGPEPGHSDEYLVSTDAGEQARISGPVGAGSALRTVNLTPLVNQDGTITVQVLSVIAHEAATYEELSTSLTLRSGDTALVGGTVQRRGVGAQAQKRESLINVTASLRRP